MTNNNDILAKERSEKKVKERERRRDLSKAFDDLTQLLFELDPVANQIPKRLSHLEVAKRATKSIQTLKQSNVELHQQLDEKKLESPSEEPPHKGCAFIVPNPNVHGNIFCPGAPHHNVASMWLGQSYPHPLYYNAFPAGFQQPGPHMVAPHSSSTSGIDSPESPFPLSRSINAADEAPGVNDTSLSELDWQPISCPELEPLSLESFSSSDHGDCDSLAFDDGMDESL